MRFSLVALFSVLALALAAPDASSELTSTEEKIFDNFLEFSHGDFDKYIKRFVELGKTQFCENEDFNLEIPYGETVNRFEAVSKEDLSSLTFCAIFKTKFPYIVEPLVKAIDNECLREEQKGTAELIVEIITSMVSEICAFSGEEIMELFNPCYSKIDFGDGECFRPPKISLDDDNDYTRGTPKQELCRGYAEIRHCLETGIRGACKLSITRRTAMTFMDNVLSCK